MVLRKLFTIDPRTNGQGPCIFAWTPQGTFLAIAGSNKRLVIADRNGTTVHTVSLPNPTPVIDMHWNVDGSVLAIVQATSQNVGLYSMVSKTIEQVATGQKADVCIARWSHTDPVLCIGNVKGGVVMFNSETFKKVPIVGKHSKKIISCSWNRRGQVALSSEDKTLTVSDHEGKTVDSVNIKGDATDVKWADRKRDERKTGQIDSTVSMTGNQKAIVLFVPETKDGLVELAFNKKYGNLVGFEWFGDGYLICGFANGHVTIVSTHLKEIGNEIAMMKSHRDALSGLTVNKSISKGCAIGDNYVRTFDLDELKLSDSRSEKHEFDAEFGALTQCGWTDDGQILTVASKNGAVYGFVTRIPVLSASHANHVLFFSSLRELCVRDVVASVDVARIEVEIEPAYVAIGNGVVAVGSINNVWYYRFDTQATGQTKCACVCQREARQVVHDVKASSQYGALLMNDLGMSELHALTSDGGNDPNRPPRSFPDKKDQGKVTSHAMTDGFYIFGTSSGVLNILSLVDMQVVTEYQHISPIRYLKPNLMGTRVAWIDGSNNGSVFNPANETACTIDGLPPAADSILWDPSDYGSFVAADSRAFTSFAYSPNTRYGPTAVAIKKRLTPDSCITPRPYAFVPVLMFRGVVMCQTPTGALAPVTLVTHQTAHYAQPGDAEAFHFFIEMNRLTEALAIATTQEQQQTIAERSLHVLNVELAIRIYRDLCRPTMVMCLERIRHIHERNVLLGHISMIFRQFDDAQNCFTRSSNPTLALEMRRDLLHWDQALHLAETLAPDQVPVLSKECAQQYEFRGEFSNALEAYRKGTMPVPPVPQNASPSALAARTAAELHNAACVGGQARCTLRMGDVRQGIRMLKSVENKNSKALLIECASILEQMKQFDEAAGLFEQAEEFERAANIYIKETKQLKAAARVLQHIQSRNILTMFAKAKETGEHSYAEAAQAYEKAEDWDNVVRIKVEHLNDLHGAYAIVRRTRSVEAAQMVANVCRKRNETNVAVEFLLLAKKYQEAFELAKESKAMTAFETALLQQVRLNDGVAPADHKEHFMMVAEHYAGLKSHLIAGDYYTVAGHFPKALDKYLLVGTEESIDKAIAVVGKGRSDQLAHKLIDYLMGEVDGEPKDPKNIFKLYMALGSYEKAAKTAVMIASREQEQGRYQPARKILIDTCLVLHEKGMRVSTDLRRALLLVHSYLIVKHLMKPMENMDAAVRMLLRVARNIQKFPAHVATILTTTVVQCIKADFRASAYKYACTLVQTPELRSEIPEKQRKKIEQVVRKKGREELVDPPESTSQCPICHNPVLETNLECGACKNALPFCLVTGKHLAVDDWCVCPSCNFPALHSEFVKLLKDDPRCPLCEKPVNPATLEKVAAPDVKAYV